MYSLQYEKTEYYNNVVYIKYHKIIFILNFKRHYPTIIPNMSITKAQRE